MIKYHAKRLLLTIIAVLVILSSVLVYNNMKLYDFTASELEVLDSECTFSMYCCDKYSRSTLFKLPDEKTILFYSGDISQAQSILEVLTENSIYKIDFLIIASPDFESASAVSAFLKHCELGTVYIPYIESENFNSEELFETVYSTEQASLAALDDYNRIYYDDKQKLYVEIFKTSGGTVAVCVTFGERVFFAADKMEYEDLSEITNLYLKSEYDVIKMDSKGYEGIENNFWASPEAFILSGTEDISSAKSRIYGLKNGNSVTVISDGYKIKIKE